MQCELQICEPATTEEQITALELVLKRQARDDIHLTQPSAACAVQLLAAKRGGRIVGAVLGEIHRGEVAGVLPPQIVDGEQETTAVALIQALHFDLAARNISLAQSLLPSNQERDAHRLLQADYRHAADLLYLAGNAAPAGEPRKESPLKFAPFQAADFDRMADLVERTYCGTLDCPMLNGLCDARQTLEGYRAVDGWKPEFWRFVQFHGQDVGCLLQTDAPASGHLELVYMGVAPQHRGQGWGREIVSYLQHFALRMGRKTVTCTVDRENLPAVEIYLQSGFKIAWRRSVFLNELKYARRLAA